MDFSSKTRFFFFCSESLILSKGSTFWQRPVWFVFWSVLWGGKLQSLLVLCYIYSGACYRNREIFLFVTSLKLIWRNWDERVIFVHVKALFLLSFLDFDWCLVILDSWFWLWSSTATFPPIFFGRLMDPNDYSSCNQIAWSSKMGFFFCLFVLEVCFYREVRSFLDWTVLNTLVSASLIAVGVLLVR